MKKGRQISDYMTTELMTLLPDTGIVHAVSFLLEKNISGAPVVDANGQLVGVLSMKDCLKAALNASYYQDWGGAVSDYMSYPVETLEADLDIVETAEHLLSSHFRRFPVQRDGHLVGQISRADVLKALVDNWSYQ
ncbi:CBS domain-containing protein [uncultured Maritalea sp.]|uniref:CBS domain-containing protein n=1 Tax=uncultured Maritalea sp. TaxID=757249 RepID=UPI00263132AD|nr:CBS domain-containing protein [uncultured Maritalea sp.]